jgi:hypothetical protein
VYVTAAVVAAVVDGRFQSDFCCSGRRVGCAFVASGEANEPTLSKFRREPHFQAQTCTRRGELLVRGMQSILAKSMKDSVVRGRLLQLFYERRGEGSLPFGQGEQAVPPPGGINRRDWLRALAQLSEYHLIDWIPLEDQSGMGLLSGFAKINDFGVKVLEGGAAPPISISIDKSRRTTAPRRQTPTAPSTPQQQVIMEALEKVITAINQADVSEQEKDEAKTLLRKLLGSRAAVSVLGPRAQSLAAKYFAG